MVFDSYPATAGTKRRAKPLASPEVIFDCETVNQVAQAQFLANEQNKKRLIDLLATHFESLNIEVKQALEDDDVLVVQTALIKSAEQRVVIVGEVINVDSSG